MPAWLLPILGLLGGEAAHRGGRALLVKLLGQKGRDAVQRGISTAATRAASRVPTTVGRRFLTPERLSGAAMTTGGILGGAALFGAGNEAVHGLLGESDPYMPPGAESLMGGPVQDSFPDLESLMGQLALPEDETEDGVNPRLETLLRDSASEVMAGGRLF